MKIIFAGTPVFAVPALTELLAHHEVLAIITNPDAARRRGNALCASPIKQTALRIAPKIPIFTAPINELYEEITRLAPDVLIVTAYGQIIPNAVLSIPRYGALNIHPSLLPRHRGPSPIQAAILSGDAETGVTIMQVVEKMDAGPIITQSRIQLKGDEPAGALHDILAREGARLLIQTLEKPLFPHRAQDEREAIYTKKITSQDAELNVKEPAYLLERKIRAYNPSPGAHITITNYKLLITNDNLSATNKPLTSKRKLLRLKIWNVKIKKSANDAKKSVQVSNLNQQFYDANTFTPDKNIIIIDKLPALCCGDGNVLILTEVQPEGKKRMSGEEFVRGYIHQ